MAFEDPSVRQVDITDIYKNGTETKVDLEERDRDANRRVLLFDGLVEREINVQRNVVGENRVIVECCNGMRMVVSNWIDGWICGAKK